MEAEKEKYRKLIENEEQLRTEEGNQWQEDEKIKERQASISEQERTILDLKNQIKQLKKAKRARNLFLVLGMIVIVVLSNVLLSFGYNYELEREIDEYRTKMQNNLSEMEEQLH